MPRSRSRSSRTSFPSCRRRGRSARSSCIRRRWRACISASGRWRAAACAGRTGRRISAPRCSAWSRRSSVKNAVIVPVGAKGGFVPRRLPARRPRRRSSRRAGRPISNFVDRLLSVTDDIDGDGESCRPRTSCGTMPTTPISWSPPTRAPRPSPIPPTRIALKRGFWLGDAFASGGSAGYDHKAMGITARGAWEAVKRHFREMDVDIQTPALHRRRRRRHVGRRLRQRHAAVALHQARRRLRPSRHLHRSGPRPGSVARGAPAALRRCRARAGRTTTAR